MAQKQDFVLVFAFSADGQRVALIRKNHPAFQAGKLNGVGGKIEAGETPLATTAREFKEETGHDVAPPAFRPFHAFDVKSGTVHCFYAVLPDLSVLKSPESEKIEIHTLPSLSRDRCVDGVPEMVKQAQALVWGEGRGAQPVLRKGAVLRP